MGEHLAVNTPKDDDVVFGKDFEEDRDWL